MSVVDRPVEVSTRDLDRLPVVPEPEPDVIRDRLFRVRDLLEAGWCRRDWHTTITLLGPSGEEEDRQDLYCIAGAALAATRDDVAWLVGPTGNRYRGGSSTCDEVLRYLRRAAKCRTQIGLMFKNDGFSRAQKHKVLAIVDRAIELRAEGRR